jgi:hypothetical protein
VLYPLSYEGDAGILPDRPAPPEWVATYNAVSGRLH